MQCNAEPQPPYVPIRSVGSGTVLDGSELREKGGGMVVCGGVCDVVSRRRYQRDIQTKRQTDTWSPRQPPDPPGNTVLPDNHETRYSSTTSIV